MDNPGETSSSSRSDSDRMDMGIPKHTSVAHDPFRLVDLDAQRIRDEHLTRTRRNRVRGTENKEDEDEEGEDKEDESEEAGSTETQVYKLEELQEAFEQTGEAIAGLESSLDRVTGELGKLKESIRKQRQVLDDYIAGIRTKEEGGIKLDKEDLEM